MDTESRRFMKHYLPYTSIHPRKSSKSNIIDFIGKLEVGITAELISKTLYQFKVIKQTDPVDTRLTQMRGGVQFETCLPPETPFYHPNTKNSFPLFSHSSDIGEGANIKPN